MKWPACYLAAIVLHLVVLFGFCPSQPKETEHYMQITLVARGDPQESVAKEIQHLPLPDAKPIGANFGTANVIRTISSRVVAAPPSQPSSGGVAKAAGISAHGGIGNGFDGDGSFERNAFNTQMRVAPRAMGDGSVAQCFGEWNGHYYEIVAAPDGINWYDAYMAAQARGGRLATIPRRQDDLAEAKARGLRSPGRGNYLTRARFINNFISHPAYWRRQTTNEFRATTTILWGSGWGTNRVDGFLVDARWPNPLWSGPWVGDNIDFIHNSEFAPDGQRAWRAFYDETVENVWYRYAYVPKTELAYSYLVEYDYDPRTSAKTSGLASS